MRKPTCDVCGEPVQRMYQPVIDGRLVTVWLECHGEVLEISAPHGFSELSDLGLEIAFARHSKGREQTWESHHGPVYVRRYSGDGKPHT